MAVNYQAPTFTGGTPSSLALTQAFADVEIALRDAVSINGHTPNAMEEDFDLNGHELLNAGKMGNVLVTSEDLEDILIRLSSIESDVQNLQSLRSLDQIRLNQTIARLDSLQGIQVIEDVLSRLASIETDVATLQSANTLLSGRVLSLENAPESDAYVKYGTHQQYLDSSPNPPHVFHVEGEAIEELNGTYIVATGIREKVGGYTGEELNPLHLKRNTDGELELANPVITLEMFGIVDDGVTDNATAFEALEAHLRANPGSVVRTNLTGKVITTLPIVAVSYTDWDTMSCVIENTRTTDNNTLKNGVYFGNLSRTDIGRFLGAEEKAIDVGPLGVGDTEMTLGNRWNNTLEDYSNPVTWVPQIGDLCYVATQTARSGPEDASRPQQMFACHRRITAVNGSAITIDRGVADADDYFIVPLSRGLGYDRSIYGGYGYTEIVTDISFKARVNAPNGFPLNPGAVINSYIYGEYNGRAIIYGNGLRETKVKAWGVFTRQAVETAFGSEDFDLEFHCTYDPQGDTPLPTLIQLGEDPRGGKISNSTVSAVGWKEAVVIRPFGQDIEIDGLHVTTSSDNTLLAIGSTEYSTDRLKIRNLYLSSDSPTMIGRLISGEKAKDVVLENITVEGVTSADTGISFAEETTGTLTGLKTTSTKAVRLSSGLLVGSLEIAGTLVRNGANLVDGSTMSSALFNQEMVQEDYDATYDPADGAHAPYVPTGSMAMTITGPCTFDSPVLADFKQGDIITLMFQQSNGGGHALAFASGDTYRGITLPTAGNTNSKRFSMTVMHRGSYWMCIATNAVWG